MDNKFTKEELERAKELQKYENKWVALVEGRVVMAGDSVEEVKENATKMGLSEYSFFLVPRSSVHYVPSAWRV